MEHNQFVETIEPNILEHKLIVKLSILKTSNFHPSKTLALQTHENSENFPKKLETFRYIIEQNTPLCATLD
jgi:hypothetical protein